MEPYGVIFDMDGVLVDSYDAHFRSWQRLAGAHGVEMTERQFAETFGRTSREIIHELWGVTDPDTVTAWDTEKEAHYRDILRADFPEMPGASDLLAELARAGFALAIGSSGPPENVRAVLEALPGADAIRAVVDGSEVQRGKPDPEVFLKAAGKLGIDPAYCAVVEDAPAGVGAARAAGMVAIALTGTAEREQLAAANVIVETLGDLSAERIQRLIEADPAE